MKIPINLEGIALAQLSNRATQLSQTAKKVEKNTASDQELREATQEFESLFLHQLMKAMRSTIPKNNLFHGGQREEIFTDMLDQEISKIAAKRGIGIADLLFQQLQQNVKD